MKLTDVLNFILLLAGGAIVSYAITALYVSDAFGETTYGVPLAVVIIAFLVLGGIYFGTKSERETVEKTYQNSKLKLIELISGVTVGIGAWHSIGVYLNYARTTLDNAELGALIYAPFFIGILLLVISLLVVVFFVALKKKHQQFSIAMGFTFLILLLSIVINQGDLVDTIRYSYFS